MASPFRIEPFRIEVGDGIAELELCNPPVNAFGVDAQLSRELAEVVGRGHPGRGRIIGGDPHDRET